MSVADFRQLIELADPDAPAFIALSLEDPNTARPIRLEADLAGVGLVLTLDESEAGQLFDALAGALRELIGAQARSKLHTDTPGAARPASDGSDRLPDRG